MSKVISKIIKKLRSPDDNEKLAALVYLTKAFKSPTELVNSEEGVKIWDSLRSTHFLERALRSESTAPLVFMILSVFCHLSGARDLDIFVPILCKMTQEGNTPAGDCLAEILSCMESIEA